jgi:chemotaxis regulatin CheY-phosphate phosphatase CheZ
MMSGQARVSLTDEEYLDIEDALGSSARGRAFLRMRDQRLRLVAIDEVRRMTMSLRDWTMARLERAGGEAQVQVLRRELQEMSAYIQKTRSEIAAMRVRDEKDSSGSSRINSATEELDAIVSSTERATSDILATAERIFALASDLPPELEHVAGEITSHATDIMTHCSFQDLTGQRITKVVNTLRYLEQRVLAMVEIWGVDDQTKAALVSPTDARPDAHLLNGPSRPGEGRTQDEIDQLLAGTLGPGAAAAVNGTAASPTTQASPPPAAAPAAGNVGQADIDKLFA